MDCFQEGLQTDYTWVKALNCELECSCDIQGVSHYVSRTKQNRTEQNITEGGIRLLVLEDIFSQNLPAVTNIHF